jgi:hypothetical protein
MSLIELAKNGYAFQLSRLFSKKVFIVVAEGNAAAQRHFEDTIQRKRTLEGRVRAMHLYRRSGTCAEARACTEKLSAIDGRDRGSEVRGSVFEQRYVAVWVLPRPWLRRECFG